MAVTSVRTESMRHKSRSAIWFLAKNASAMRCSRNPRTSRITNRARSPNARTFASPHRGDFELDQIGLKRPGLPQAHRITVRPQVASLGI
jgi:hypothetical protein